MAIEYVTYFYQNNIHICLYILPRFNTKRYKSLKCDEIDGWINGSETIAEAFTKIEVKCVECKRIVMRIERNKIKFADCAVNKVGNSIVDTLDSEERLISCFENPQETLMNYENAPVDQDLFLMWVEGKQFLTYFLFWCVFGVHFEMFLFSVSMM